MTKKLKVVSAPNAIQLEQRVNDWLEADDKQIRVLDTQICAASAGGRYDGESWANLTIAIWYRIQHREPGATTIAAALAA